MNQNWGPFHYFNNTPETILNPHWDWRLKLDFQNHLRLRKSQFPLPNPQKAHWGNFPGQERKFVDFCVFEEPAKITDEFKAFESLINMTLQEFGVGEQGAPSSSQQQNSPYAGEMKEPWDFVSPMVNVVKQEPVDQLPKKRGRYERKPAIYTNSDEVYKKFKCDTCGKRLKSKMSLEQHDRIHTNSRPYKCTNCNKTFRQQSHLNQHTRIHSGAKPYRCGTCGVDFRQQAGLRQHVLSSHDPDYKFKSHKCAICEKIFGTQTDLEWHICRNQSAHFECSICNRKFRLHSHLLAHTAPDILPCDMCGSIFNQTCLRNKHFIEKHNGRKRELKYSDESGDSTT